jgi:hypothetical protein
VITCTSGGFNLKISTSSSRTEKMPCVEHHAVILLSLSHRTTRLCVSSAECVCTCVVYVSLILTFAPRRPLSTSPFFIDGVARTLPRVAPPPPAPGSSPSVARSWALPCLWTTGASGCIAARVDTTCGSA